MVGTSLIVDHIYVEPEFRNQGYGKMIVEGLERIAKESGCVKVVAPLTSLLASILFEKCGYEKIDMGYQKSVK